MNYVELINAVLIDMNETVIAETAAGLSGTRGIQTTVKEDLNKAVRNINNEHTQWPYNYDTVRYSIFGGKKEYRFPIKVAVTSVSGTFQTNERITGGTSSAIGVLRKIKESFLTIEVVDGTFQSSETLTGANSSATATSGSILETTDVDFDSFFLVPRNLITRGNFDESFTLTNHWARRTTNPAGTATTGTPALSNASAGNNAYAAGVLRLNDGTSDQSIPTVEGEKYRLTVRFASGTVGDSSSTLRVFAGTSSDKDSDLSEDFTISDVGRGAIKTTTFTATNQQTFISLSNEASANLDVDFIEVFQENLDSKQLRFVSYDEYHSGSSTSSSEREKAHRALVDPDSGFGTPERIYKPNFQESFGVSPTPDNDSYDIEFDYWVTSEDLSVFTDIPNIPARFHDVITARTRYFAHTLRGNDNAAQFAQRDYENGIKRMRIELINHKNYMRAV